MTRPARSSSTAGSGMPATMALTAAVSTGLTPRTSSRDAATLCNRHGTSAAAPMQIKTAAARTSDSSPNATSTARARPAASRIMAECRNRSGHSEKMEEGASIAIGPALSPFGSASSGAGGPTLSHVGGFPLRLGVEPRRRLTQALHSRAQYNFSKRQQDYRYDEWRKIIEDPKQQHPPKQVFPVHLPQADQHRGIEHAEPAGRMAGEAQQRRRDKNDRDHDEAEIGFVRHQHVHRQRAEAEVDNSDRDLQQGQRTARQHYRPGPTTDPSRSHPDPDHIGHQPHDDRDRGHAVQPGRQLIDRCCRFRMTGDPEAQYRGIAEPERQASQKTDLCDVDRVQSPRGINAIAHGTPGKALHADIMPDRITGEGCERVDRKSTRLNS